jgi:hypothetical protein
MVRGILIVAALGATPALAHFASMMPEPGAIALFVIGITALVIGRSASRSSPNRDA